MTPIQKGYKRRYQRCQIAGCGRVYYRDFIPFSASNPVLPIACGHDARHDLRTITRKEFDVARSKEFRAKKRAAALKKRTPKPEAAMNAVELIPPPLQQTLAIQCAGNAVLDVEKTKDDLRVTLRSPDGERRWRHLHPKHALALMQALARLADWSNADPLQAIELTEDQKAALGILQRG